MAGTCSIGIIPARAFGYLFARRIIDHVAAAGLTFLFFGRDVIRSTWTWFINGFRGRTLDMLFRVGMIVAVIGVFAGAFLFLSQKNFFRRLWEIDAQSLSEYIVDINAGARGAYSTGALAAFEEYPWTGVGLGASGFYIYQNLPDWALTTVPEIAKQLNPENRLYPNPKNLYVRLLAETGLIGFFLFLAFQFYVLGDMLGLLRQKNTWARFAAVAGVFAWLAITFYNFTQDSLTTPNIWLVSGYWWGFLPLHCTRKSNDRSLRRNAACRFGLALQPDSGPDENHRLCRCARYPREISFAKDPHRSQLQYWRALRKTTGIGDSACLMGNTFVIKAHAAPTSASRLLSTLGLLRITYIYRDPRDAMLSAYDFGQRALAKGRPNAFSHLSDFEKSVDFMMEYVHIWEKWMTEKNVLIARYEDLLTNYDAESAKLVDYLKLDGSRPEVHAVIEKYRPDAAEGQQGLHFYKGKIGRFRESYNEEQKSVLKQKLGSYLTQMGYDA